MGAGGRSDKYLHYAFFYECSSRCFVSRVLEAVVRGTKQEKEHSDTDRCPAGDNAKAAERSTCSSQNEEAKNRMSHSSLFPDL